MMSQAKEVLLSYVLSLADDNLILGQRLSEWCYSGPYLEEDLALSNVALDYLGRANYLYEYASEIDAAGRSVDDFALCRDSRGFQNLLINELPNGDFAFTMARQFMLDAFNAGFLALLQRGSNSRLAGIAAKAKKENDYHLRRSREWVLRLGDGTELSHEKMQTAFEQLWGYTPELFELSAAEQQLLSAGIAVDRQALKPSWDTLVDATLLEARIQRPENSWAVSGGRQGIHTEHHGFLLAEMQFLQRAYPGLAW